MNKTNTLFAAIAWVQLIISLLLASSIVWGYVTYQASLGLFVRSLSASVSAVSDVVIRTAETVEARKEVLVETEKMLVVTRGLITELKTMADNQAKLVPQYSESLKALSSSLSKFAEPIQSVGETFEGISVPNLRMEGPKPVLTSTKPLEEQGKKLKATAREMTVVSKALAELSEAVGRDALKVTQAFSVTSDQAGKVISEVEKTLSRLKTQDLPQAIADLKATSENLRHVSAQVDTVNDAGVALLVVGLFLFAWCFVHSVGSLLLARSHAFASRRPTRI